MSDRVERPDTGGEGKAPPMHEAAYTTPRWVKVFGLAAVVLVMLVVVLHVSGIGGMPGPGLHTAPTEHGVQRP
jgi:hypothetical protein